MKEEFRNIARLMRAGRRRARAAWRNNPPQITPDDEKDAVKAFLAQRWINQWWKEGGHKKAFKKVINEIE